MSTAHKCDRCGHLYNHTPRTVVLDVQVARKQENRFIGWEEVDLCLGCSALLLKFLKPALRGLK